MNVMDVMAWTWTWPGSRATATATGLVDICRSFLQAFLTQRKNSTTLVSINQLNPKTLVLKIKTPTQIPTSDKSM